MVKSMKLLGRLEGGTIDGGEVFQLESYSSSRKLFLLRKNIECKNTSYIISTRAFHQTQHQRNDAMQSTWLIG